MSPLLMGEAQAAYYALGSEASQDYEMLKVAILDCLGLRGGLLVAV